MRQFVLYALFALLVLSANSLDAQDNTTLIGRELTFNFGGPGSDGANAIAAMSDGGYLLGGWTALPGSPGETQSWVIRVDDRGRLIWDLPLPAAPYGISALAPALDGGSFIIDGDLASETGRTRISKLSPNGSVESQVILGSTAQDGLSAIQPTFDGGIIVAGQTGHSTRGGQDAWILKLDDTLTVEWYRTLGSTFDDAFEDVVLSMNGGYAAAGWTTGENDSVSGWLVQFDALGGIVADHAFEVGPMTELHDLLSLPDDSFLFAATSESHAEGIRNLIIGKTNYDGQVDWRQLIRAGTSALATDMSHAGDGSYLVSARLTDGELTTGLVVNFTASGQVKAANRHEGATDRFALAVAPRIGGGYALAGSALQSRTLDQDVWLVIRRQTPE